MPSAKKSKKATEEEPELEDEEMPPEAASKKINKKTKRAPEPEPEEDEEAGEEGEEPQEEEDEETMKKRRAALTKKRKKAKLVGYRSLAKSAGIMPSSDDGQTMPARADSLHTLISVADAKRLMRFVPATPGAHGFDQAEFGKRMELFKHGVPESAARETQARCDAVLRQAVEQAVMRAVEAGKKTISPSMMAAVLRPYAGNMEFTAVTPPLGLLRHAQNVGLLNAPESDQQKSGEEKKACNANKKMFMEFMDAEEKRKVDVKQARADKASKAAEAAAAAEAAVAAV